jgi:hypothetical protein
MVIADQSCDQRDTHMVHVERKIRQPRPEAADQRQPHDGGDEAMLPAISMGGLASWFIARLTSAGAKFGDILLSR